MNRYRMTAIFQDKVIGEATFSGSEDDALSIQKFFGLANWGGMVILNVCDVTNSPEVIADVFHLRGRGE